MARFIASIKGARGGASRLGTEASGISSHTRGWNIGGTCEVVARGEHDTAILTLTGGSNGHANLGLQVVAFEGMTRGTEYIVRLPGDIEIRGIIGDACVRAYDVSEGYDAPSEPFGRLVYTFGKSSKAGTKQ